MKENFRPCLSIILCLISLSVQAKNQPAARYNAPADTAYVELRVPTATALDKFRNDAEFNYTRDVQYGTTLWEAIQYYIAKFFSRLYDLKDADRWLNRLWIALLASVAILGAVKMMGVDISRIFFNKPPPVVELNEALVDENVDRDRLTAMLEKVLSEKQYRLAARLTYLIALKRLAEAEQICRKADKTNRAYLNEIVDPQLKQPFANLTRLYEYVWYGDFDIRAEHYTDIENNFNELNRRLR